MRHLILFVGGMLLPLALVLGASKANGRQAAISPKGQREWASISGRVIINGNAAPAGISVALVENPKFPNAKVFATTATDSAGYYVFKNVQPREYWVKPQTEHRYVNRGEQRPGLGVEAFVYRPGVLEHVDLDLISSATISGTVTGADGRPVAHQQIYLDAPTGRGRYYPPFVIFSFVKVEPEVRRIYDLWVSLGKILTDDQGFYRIEGLTAGRYIVSVGEDIANLKGEVTMRGGVPEGNSGTVETNPYYPMTFHPGVTDISKAAPVEVATGSQVEGVNIRVGPAVRAFHLSGRTVDADTGKPVGNCQLRMSHPVQSGRSEDLLERFRSDDAGNFDIDGLIPNRYFLSASGGEGSDLYSDEMRFDIGDSDVTGVEVKLARGRTLTGLVVVEGEPSTEVLGKLRRIKLSAFHSELSVDRGTTVAADGTYTLTGLPPGKVTFGLDNYGSPDLYPFSIRRIEHPLSNGDDSIEMGTKDLTGVRIVLKYAGASVQGKVNIVGPRLPSDLKLWVSYWCQYKEGGGKTSLISVMPDDSFQFDGLSPGECDITLFYGSEPRKRAAPDQPVLVPSTGSAKVEFEVNSATLVKQ